MDLRQLQYFCRIAESGSFRQAAERANVAQSALSRHMRTLEDELGVTLLERHARGIRLTAQGEKLKQRADRILRDVEDTRAELTSSGASPHGSVTIGASATTSRLLYARLAETTSKRYPDIELRITEGASYFLLEGLDTGRIDLAVMVAPESRSYLSTEPLVTEKVYLVASARHANMPDAPCTVRDLAGRPLFLFSRPSGSRMLLETVGYGIMPYSSVFRDVASGELVACEFEGIDLTRTFIRRMDRPSSPAVSIIADLVREEFASLKAEGMFGTETLPVRLR